MKKLILALLLSISVVTVAHSAIELEEINAGSTTGNPYIFTADSVQVNFPVSTTATDFFQFTIGSTQDISFSITPNDGAGVNAVHVYFDGEDVFGQSIAGSGTTEVSLGELEGPGTYTISVSGKTNKQNAGFYTLTSPVPELSTMVLMLSGFSLIGFMSYRRRVL
ncbi:FxDxF family PEP-CTERM protein [Cycloclasticus pugetii]|uniref:FxDxF family PEP-CTERM protein n=1 Tax=Cycloclasticus pugetii TaxID=34068 RepID=UPI00037A0420|nr:FxDxF family PEP-CTERM protein [Cycloclasticus pugetii]